MERYLLFDAQCLTCSKLAQAVTSTTNGWMTARSLHDPQMQSLLAQTQNSQKWEPTLLEVQDDQVRVYRGMALRFKLLSGLGLKRTMDLLQALHQTVHHNDQLSASRRSFLTKGRMLAGGLLVAVGIEPLLSSHAFAAKPNSTGPLTTTSLSAETARQLVQHSKTFQEAVSHLGEPNWDLSHAYQYTDSSGKGVVLFFAGSTNTTTFLALDDPTASNTSIGLIGQLTHQSATQAELVWKTHTGEVLATQIFSQDGKSTVTPATQQPQTVSPNFNVGCFIHCLGGNVSASCVMSCITCVQVPLSLACVVCGICAGPAGVKCAKQC